VEGDGRVNLPVYAVRDALRRLRREQEGHAEFPTFHDELADAASGSFEEVLGFVDDDEEALGDALVHRVLARPLQAVEQ
jgi:hypothetical protein